MSKSEVRAPSHFVDAIRKYIQRGVEAGVLCQRVADVPYRGRAIEVDGHELVNFGGCSYLGLAQHPHPKEAAIRAIERFGTQFSFSRGYLESPLYQELEAELVRMVGGGTAIVSASTSLGHMAALPSLISARDVVLVDQSAHASLH